MHSRSSYTWSVEGFNTLAPAATVRSNWVSTSSTRTLVTCVTVLALDGCCSLRISATVIAPSATIYSCDRWFSLIHVFSNEAEGHGELLDRCAYARLDECGITVAGRIGRLFFKVILLCCYSFCQSTARSPQHIIACIGHP